MFPRSAIFRHVLLLIFFQFCSDGGFFVLSVSGGIFYIGYFFFFNFLCWALIFGALFPPTNTKIPPGRRRILHIFFFFCVLVSTTVPIVGVIDRYLWIWIIGIFVFLALGSRCQRCPFFLFTFPLHYCYYEKYAS